MNPRLEYFFGNPPSTDKLWAAECQSVWEFCQGRVLDPGAGFRTLTEETIRCDIRPDTNPQHVGSALKLPFPDDGFDAIFSSHLLEHLPQPKVALTEWLRVVKPGGYVCSVIPDTRFTHGQNTDPTPHLWEWAPSEFLHQVFGWDGKGLWWKAKLDVDWCEFVQCDVAGPSWSFNVVVRKR